MKTIYKKGAKIEFKKEIQYKDFIENGIYPNLKLKDDNNSVLYENQPDVMKGIIEEYDFTKKNYKVKYRPFKNNGVEDYERTLFLTIQVDRITFGPIDEMETIYEKGTAVMFKKNFEYKDAIEVRFMLINRIINDNSVLFEGQPEDIEGIIEDHISGSNYYIVKCIPLKRNGQKSIFGETVSVKVNSDKFI